MSHGVGWGGISPDLAFLLFDAVAGGAAGTDSFQENTFWQSRARTIGAVSQSLKEGFALGQLLSRS